ncbi:hypothetical protein [Bacillus toyonensis]|uniref:hypothetical protein n=1 Tax=Bacillus toyonensis TaxID=155322 RepID=UPI00027939C7|nr:hypothetical protein [Bacillus toyonensis]EJQ82454.1 hypothetical protein IGK_01350 [Bacillus toyonensis]
MSYKHHCNCNKCKRKCKRNTENQLEDIQLLIQEQLQLQAQLQEQVQAQLQLQIQLQAQLQAQSQTQTDTDTISNVGNPTQTVNVAVTGSGTSVNESSLVEFQSVVRDSLSPLNPSTPLGTETRVAEVTLNDIAAGNRVLLNGLFFVDNDAASFNTLRVRIYKNAIASANMIYDANFIEVDAEGTNDQNQPIPVLHVDTATANQTNVIYILTALSTDDVLLRGPITFTASEIKG